MHRSRCPHANPPPRTRVCSVSLVFGGITMVAGLVGVPLGTVLSQVLKRRYPRADPLICASGLLISAPFLLGAMFVVSTNSVAAYVLIFLGSVALNLNWAIVADILLVRHQTTHTHTYTTLTHK